MRDVTGWPADVTVSQPSCTVYVNGAAREAESFSVSASVSGGSDVAARTGDVEWVPAGSVSRAQDTVLSAGVPMRGDRVSIDAGYGDAVSRIFTGRVDTTEAVIPGGVSSDVADYWDRLDTEVSVPAVATQMPPYFNLGSKRFVGMTPTWTTQRALALAGFFATPPVRAGAALSASLNGSLWPEVGSVTDTVTQDYPVWFAAPWGDGAERYTCRFGGGDRSMADGPLEISFLVDDTVKANASYVEVVATNGNRVRVVIDGNGDIHAQYGTSASSLTTVASLADNVRGELVVLRVTSLGNWLLTSGDASDERTRTISTAMQGVPDQIIAAVPLNGRNIGGLNVAYTSTTRPTWRRTAILDSSETKLRAARAYVRVKASDILADRAEAEKARMWIDADAVFHWVRRDRWGAGVPVKSLTGIDLLGYGMAVDYDSTYSAVKVSAITPTISTRRTPNITLHEGGSQTLEAGDDSTIFIEVPEDEDWPMVDPSMDIYGVSGTAYDFNRARGTWGGATRVTSDGEVDFWAQGPEGNYATHTFTQLDSRKWSYTVTVKSSMNSADVVETRTVRQDKYAGNILWSQWDAKDLPLIRGWSKVTWEDVSETTSTGAAATLPILEHDAGWWVQDAHLATLRAWLAAKHATPTVVIRDLKIVPDARIELGDVLNLTDSTYAGLTARVVVSGITYSGSNGQAEMSLDVEVISASVDSPKTYADVQAQASASTYAAFAALIGNKTYSVQEAA